LIPKVFEGLEKWRNTIDEVTESKPWITEEEKSDVLKKIQEMQSWLDEKVKEQSTRKLSEDPVFNALEVEKKLKPVEKLYKKVTNRKKPKEKKIKPDKKDEKEDKEEKEEKEDKEEKKTSEEGAEEPTD